MEENGRKKTSTSRKKNTNGRESGSVKTPIGEVEYVRYKEGAKRYGISYCSFVRLANEAHAVYRIRNICIVDVKMFEEYLNTFRV